MSLEFVTLISRWKIIPAFTCISWVFVTIVIKIYVANLSHFKLYWEFVTVCFEFVTPYLVFVTRELGICHTTLFLFGFCHFMFLICHGINGYLSQS